MDEVLDDVYRIDVPRPGQSIWKIDTDEPVSCHVSVGRETLLFGTGYGTTGDALVEQLTRFDRVDVAFVEHGHNDHYGGLPTLLDWNDDLVVAMPGEDSDVLKKVYNGITADVAVEHDEVYRRVRAIKVPGHTPGNTSFLDESRGILFAGDTVVHSDSEIAAPGDWSGPFAPIHPVYSAKDDLARENLVVLDDYEFDAVLLTHGENVLTDAKDAFETLLDDLCL